MSANEDGVALVASAILDGTPIDWADIEAGVSEEERQLLEELRLLSTVAAIQRHVPPLDGEPPDLRDSGGMQYWGRLRLIERVGGGSFGDVYRAWDPRLHREVALKLMPVEAGDGRRRSAEILREGRLLARVRHPGVVTIYDAEQIESRVGLCMEFVDGSTLEQRVAQTGQFTPLETVSIGLQLCDALAAAHGAGVLHRDVKASNVIVKDDGRIVLMDFGAGRALEDALTSDSTGTPLYLAPEVLQGREATIRSDVYSLGVLLYHLLTGSYPVTARSLAELRDVHRRRLGGARRDVPAQRASVAPRLQAVIERAIDPVPARRYENVAALARDLRAISERPRLQARGFVIGALVLIAAGAGVIVAMRESGWYAAVQGAAASQVSQPAEPVRIAILPFAVTGDDPDGMLQKGFTRDLIRRLELFDNVDVIAAGSVLSTDTGSGQLLELGQRLGVAAVVRASLVRSAESVVADVKLLRLPDEERPWEQQYKRPMAARLEIPRTIALDLAGALGLRRQRSASALPTHNPDAAALYVRGRTEYDKFTPDGLGRARQIFEAALKVDPNYAEVHAMMAQVYLQPDPPFTVEEPLQRATQAAERAMMLAPWSPESYVAAAAVKSARADWTGARVDFLQAVDLEPSNVHVRQQFAHWLVHLGYFQEALEHARMAELLDPLSPRALIAVASVHRFSRNFEAAVEQAHKALALDPHFSTAYFSLGHSYQGLGRLKEAIAAYEKMGRPSGNLGNAYAQAGYTDKAYEVIAYFEAKYEQTGSSFFAGNIAQVYCGLGEIDKAFAWLELPQRFPRAPATFRVAAVWDPLRNDPRFQALLKNSGLDR